MATADLTVRGAGILGLSAAFIAAERGARVRVIDPGGAGAGASGGILGALAPHAPDAWNAKKAFQLASLVRAESFWAAVEARGGQVSGYGRVGRIQVLETDQARDLARARAGNTRDLWPEGLRWEVLSENPAPGWAPEAPAGWIFDTLSARLHPRQAVAALVAALGVPILAGGEDAGPVIWATGVAGLEALSDSVGANLGGGVKGQAALLDFDARDRPQLFLDGLHVVPHRDGTTAIGSTSERDFADPTATDAALDRLIAEARRMCPALAEAPVIARWAGVRPRARSRAPMLGPWPGRTGHFVLNGGFKIGFGMAPGLAELAVDLALEGRDRVPEAFRLEASLPKSARGMSWTR